MPFLLTDDSQISFKAIWVDSKGELFFYRCTISKTKTSNCFDRKSL